MSIFVRKELDFEDIKRETWCCDDVLETIENHDLEDDFMAHLEEMYYMNDSELPTITELNDYIRFESEAIFECLGISDDEEEDTEADEN